MDVSYDPHEIAARFGRLVDDLRRLLAFHGLRSGAPQYLSAFARKLEESKPFRTDFTALVRSTRDAEHGRLTSDQMLSLIAVAVGGDALLNDPGSSPDTTRTIALLLMLLAGIGGWSDTGTRTAATAVDAGGGPEGARGGYAGTPRFARQPPPAEAAAADPKPEAMDVRAFVRSEGREPSRTEDRGESRWQAPVGGAAGGRPQAAADEGTRAEARAGSPGRGRVDAWPEQHAEVRAAQHAEAREPHAEVRAQPAGVRAEAHTALRREPLSEVVRPPASSPVSPGVAEASGVVAEKAAGPVAGRPGPAAPRMAAATERATEQAGSRPIEEAEAAATMPASRAAAFAVGTAAATRSAGGDGAGRPRDGWGRKGRDGDDERDADLELERGDGLDAEAGSEAGAPDGRRRRTVSRRLVVDGALTLAAVLLLGFGVFEGLRAYHAAPATQNSAGGAAGQTQEAAAQLGGAPVSQTHEAGTAAGATPAAVPGTGPDATPEEEAVGTRAARSGDDAAASTRARKSGSAELAPKGETDRARDGGAGREMTRQSGAPAAATGRPKARTAAPAAGLETASLSVPHGPVPVPEATMDQQLVAAHKPLYPAAALAQHVQGTVVLRAYVSTDGTVRRTDVIAGPPSLINSALAAASWRRYRPFLLHGRPVEVQTEITLHYNLP